MSKDINERNLTKRRRSSLFGKRKTARLPASLIVIGIVIALFALISPVATWDQENIKVVLPSPPNPLPTITRIPQPTDVHGGRILFTCTRGDYNQLCLINADGSGYKRITDHNANDYYPTFSPQGNSIAYASLQDGSFDLFLMILTNSKLYRLTRQIGNAFSPSFSPDGSQIAFLNKVGNAPISLWLVKSSGSDVHQIYVGPRDIVAAAWSSMGSEIAFAMAVDTDYSYQLFLIAPEKSSDTPQRVSQGMDDIGGSLDWSPDGELLLFYAGPANGRNIYTLNVQSGEVTQLTFGGNNAAASYSPDGQYIVYNSLRNNNQADLYIMRADGHSTRQLTSDPEPDWQPDWAP